MGQTTPFQGTPTPLIPSGMGGVHSLTVPSPTKAPVKSTLPPPKKIETQILKPAEAPKKPSDDLYEAAISAGSMVIGAVETTISFVCPYFFKPALTTSQESSSKSSEGASPWGALAAIGSSVAKALGLEGVVDAVGTAIEGVVHSVVTSATAVYNAVVSNAATSTETSETSGKSSQNGPNVAEKDQVAPIQKTSNEMGVVHESQILTDEKAAFSSSTKSDFYLGPVSSAGLAEMSHLLKTPEFPSYSAFSTFEEPSNHKMQTFFGNLLISIQETSISGRPIEVEPMKEVLADHLKTFASVIQDVPTSFYVSFDNHPTLKIAFKPDSMELQLVYDRKWERPSKAIGFSAAFKENEKYPILAEKGPLLPVISRKYDDSSERMYVVTIPLPPEVIKSLQASLKAQSSSSRTMNQAPQPHKVADKSNSSDQFGQDGYSQENGNGGQGQDQSQSGEENNEPEEWYPEDDNRATAVV